MELLNDYRKEAGINERLLLVEKIYFKIKPDLSGFVFKNAHPSVAEEVLHETLRAIVTHLDGFRGRKEKQFWAWSYRIARRKAYDLFHRQFSNKVEPMPPDELERLVTASARAKPLSPADKLDLEYAMNLLEKAKPECRKFLWKHFVLGWKFTEMAKELGLKSDAIRMKVNRCLSLAQGLI